MINRFLLITFLCLAFGMLKADDNGYHIKVKIKHVQDDQLFLGYHFGNKQYVKDTAEVKDQTVVFQGNEALPGGIYFVYGPNTYFEFVVEEQKFTLATDTADYMNHMEVTGSKANELFYDYRNFLTAKQKKAKSLNEKLDEVKDDEAATESIKDQLKTIDKEVKDYQQKLVEQHPNTMISQIIKATTPPDIPEAPKDENGEPKDEKFAYHYYKAHFFDDIDFQDGRILRSPVFQQKINEYMEKLTPQHPDSISKSAQHIIDKAKGNQELFRYLVVTLTTKYETSKVMGMEAVFTDLAKKYYLTGNADWADSATVDKIRKRVYELEPNRIGKVAPNMTVLDTSMNPMQLHSIPAKYMVLFFYDPECGHCKKETPKLKQIYQDSLEDKGVRIMAVSTVTDVEKWKAFVAKHDLPFINAADPHVQSNFRQEYDIKSTPTIYVLDQKKKIIAKRIGVEQLNDFIDRQIEIEKAKAKKE